MTLKELQDELKLDMKIDGSDLGNESSRTPDLHNKYNKVLFSEKLSLKKLKRQWDILYKDQWEWYTKRAPDEVYEQKPLTKLKKILPSDVKMYLASDPELQELREKIETKEELVEYLDRAMTAINSRQWLIRGGLDFFRFTNGLN